MASEYILIHTTKSRLSTFSCEKCQPAFSGFFNPPKADTELKKHSESLLSKYVSGRVAIYALNGYRKSIYRAGQLGV